MLLVYQTFFKKNFFDIYLLISYFPSDYTPLKNFANRFDSGDEVYVLIFFPTIYCKLFFD